MTSDLIAVAFVVLGAIGLAGSVVVARRRGVGPALTLAAWSLLLIGLWLVGATRLIARLVTAIGSFVTGLVFSPVVWLGVVILGLSVVLFVAGAWLRGRVQGDRVARPARQRGATQQKGIAAKPVRDSDDDFAEIEEILRRRGIS